MKIRVYGLFNDQKEQTDLKDFLIDKDKKT